MSPTQRDCAIIEAWIRAAVAAPDADSLYRSSAYDAIPNIWQANRVRYTNRSVNSYGSHFPLAEVARVRGRRPTIVLNGDVWPGGGFASRTQTHQGTARTVAESLVSAGVASMIIVPFSAMDGAGIDRASIVPIDVRPDRWELEERYATRFADMPEWRRDREQSTLEATSDSRGFVRVGSGFAWLDRVHVLGDSLFSAVVPGSRNIVRPLELEDMVRSIDAARRYSATYEENGRAAADRLERAIGNMPDDIRETVTTRPRRIFVSSFDRNEPGRSYFLAQLPHGARPRTVAAAIDALAPRAVHAAIARGRMVDRQGDIFAIETAMSDADIYGAAITRARLTQWTRAARPRPGEIGHVPRDVARARVRAAYIRRRNAHGWVSPSGRDIRGSKVTAPREPSDMMRDRAEGERARRIAEAIKRRRSNRAASRPAGPRSAIDAYHRASFDMRYLPREGDSRTIAERYRDIRADGWESRKPRTARRYPPLERYSDIRTLEEYPARDLERARLEHENNRTRARAHGPETASRALWLARSDVFSVESPPIVRALSLHGTAHTATEVVRCRGGRLYARGIMRHEPTMIGERRERDHVNRKLGDGTTWFLIVRNTVPRARTARTNERGN